MRKERNMTHFQVFGARPVLYQWDTGRRVIVLCDCQEVHFSNALDGEALVVVTYEEGGTRYANIPNILLQSALPLNVYAYVCAGERYTQRATVLEVNPRSKPADYVYTETEVKNYDALAKLITALEERLTDLESGGVPGSVAEPDLVIGFNRAHVLLDTISASTFYVESGSLSAIKELVLSGKSPNIKIRCVFSGAGGHTEYNFTPSGHYYKFKSGDEHIIIEFVARFGSSLKEYTMKAIGEDIELNRFTEASSANIVPVLGEDTDDDALSAGNTVMTTPQALTEDQQTQARENIGAVGAAELTGAVADALTEAKESGKFKGDPGEPGTNYVLTAADKTEIAEQAAGLVDAALLAIIGEVSV